MTEYKEFLGLLLAQLNAGRRDRLRVEMQYLQKLPDRRLESVKRERVKVDSGSLIYVDRNVYSVHSRLIGEKVEARLGAEIIEVWYAGRKVEQLLRCEAGANIESTTGTSSSGWCASPARLKTTAIERTCFRPAGFAWPRTRCGRRPQRASKDT